MASTPEVPQGAPEQGTLGITRQFAAEPQRVWALWTDPDELAQWFGSRDVHADRASITIEAREGGRWWLDMVETATGRRFPLRASLTALNEPEYLEGRVSAETGMGEELRDVSLQVWFVGNPKGTSLTIRQGPFAPEQVETTTGGWLQSFEKADALLAAQRL